MKPLTRKGRNRAKENLRSLKKGLDSTQNLLFEEGIKMMTVGSFHTESNSFQKNESTIPYSIASKSILRIK